MAGGCGCGYASGAQGFLAFGAGSGPAGAPPQGGSVTVSYTLPPGTATRGVDYSGLLATDSTVVVPVYGTVIKPFYATADNLVEGVEVVRGKLAPGAGYYVGQQDEASVNLVDRPPVVSVEETDPNSAEPVYDIDGNETKDNATLTFTRKDGDATKSLAFAYSLGGTADSSDYTIDGPLSFRAYETSITRVFAPVQDGVAEPAETSW